MGSGTAMAQQRQHNGTSDEDGVVSSTVETDGTEIKAGGNKKLEVNGIVYSVVSEETEEEERQADMISALGDTRMDMDDNAMLYNAPDEGFHIETFDYPQEELYEAIDRIQNTGDEEASSVSNNEIVNNKEKQKDIETINGEPSFEQMESTQSSQLTNTSSSSGYNPSPTVHKKGARVSVHRELDADYERSTDNSNVRL